MLRIDHRVIGPGQPALLVAEVAQAHDGSLGMAHAYVDAVAEAGVDAVKFQTHIAAAESTLDEPFRVKFSVQDATRYAYWQRMEFSFEQWQGLAEHARERGLVFLSSPFSMQAVEMLVRLDMPAWKVGSGETVSGDILDTILGTRKPLLISTGMSSFAELDVLIKKIREQDTPFALFQCTSKYPVDFSEVGLNVMRIMRERYNCPVGLSDHSGSILPPLAALGMGADILEAHIVFDKRMFGPDTSASLTVEDFKFLVKARDAFHDMHTNPVDKDKMAESLQRMRGLFGKSLALKSDFPAGSVLTEDMLTAKKPGTGIQPDQRKQVVGKTLRNDVFQDRLLRWEDLEE